MKRTLSQQLLPIVVSPILGLPFTGAALAQQESAGQQLQEVVVTAQKRASTVQETPISITAITGQELQDRGITDIASIVQSVPGVSMRSSGPGQTELEMRGMTSGGGNSSTVGFYLDDTPLTSPASAQNGKVVIDPNLYDLNRIEVLRGPQGTLYGSGSMGGTIKLVPNAPNPNAFDASGQVVLGDTDGGGFNHNENGMINLPLINDTLAVRIVGSLQHTSGWINRVVIEDGQFPAPANGGTGVPPSLRGNVAAAPVAADYKDVNNTNLTAVRMAALWKPMDRLTITPSFLYQEITQDGLSLIDSQPATNTDNNYQPFDAPEPFLDRFELGSLNFQYHFDFAELSSTTSYWTRTEELRQDGAEEIATVLEPGFGYFPLYANNNGGDPNQPGVGPNSPTSLENDSSNQWTEELRLTSSGDTAFKWLIGYFYQDFTSHWDLYVLTPEAAPVFGTTNGFTQNQPTKIIQNSFFGELTYSFTPKLSATAGLRRYDYTGTVNTAVSGWLSPSTNDSVNHYHTDESNQGLLPKFNLTYQPNKDLLVYGTAAKGFRPGGGNQPLPVQGPLTCLPALAAIGLTAPPLGFAPDSVWSYELGEKFRNADGRVTLNSAAYFENWEHVQTNIPLSCGYPFTGNSGDAHIYGGEVELDTLVAPGLLFAVNGGYSHARYVAGEVPGTTIDSRVQNVPDWTAAASLSYRHGLTESMHFISRIDYTYMGSRIDTTFQPNYLPSYDLTNIRAGVENDHWTAVLFVDNVTNKLAKLTNAVAINVNVGTFNRTAVAQPITFGLDVSYRLGK